MATENATHINDLNLTKPVGTTEQVEQLDNYHRQIKSVLKRDVNNFAGAALVYGSDPTNTDDYVFSSALTITSYTDGTIVVLKAANVNTGAATINIDSLGVQEIRNQKKQPLSAGEIVIGMNILVYDGTHFILVTSENDASIATTGASFVVTTGHSAQAGEMEGSVTTPVSHALGAAPDLIRCIAVCTTNDSPYVVGDVVDIPQFYDGVSMYGVHVRATSTHWSARIGPGGLAWLNLSNGNLFQILSHNYWEVTIVLMKVN